MNSAQKNIIWLASYPKSGNTWVRLFLQNLLNEGDQPIDINASLPIGFMHGANGTFFNRTTLLKHTVLKREEIYVLQSQSYAQIESNSLFLKTHNAFQEHDKSTAFSNEVSDKVIYIVRNPLDLVISYAHFMDKTIDETILIMKNEQHSIAHNLIKGQEQLPQFLGSWSSNVSSWLNQSAIPILLVKYEDLLEKPFEEFMKIVQFLKLDKNPKMVKKAMEFSSFNQLQAQEKKAGFNEQFSNNTNFFREGKKGQWEKILNTLQIKRLISNHEEMMRRLGYI